MGNLTSPPVSPEELGPPLRGNVGRGVAWPAAGGRVGNEKRLMGEQGSCWPAPDQTPLRGESVAAREHDTLLPLSPKFPSPGELAAPITKGACITPVAIYFAMFTFHNVKFWPRPSLPLESAYL